MVIQYDGKYVANIPLFLFPVEGISFQFAYDDKIKYKLLIARAFCRLKLPTTRLFVQQLVEANMKKQNMKALHHMWGSHRWQVVPLTKGQ